MNYDLISKYMNYKIKQLTNCGLVFFPEYNQKFIRLAFSSLFETYVNTIFYHKLDTLEYDAEFDYSTLKKEFEGKKYEILDEFSVNELVLSNEEYDKNISIIDEIIKVAYFLCRLDKVKFKSKEEITFRLLTMLDQEEDINKLLDNNLYKLVNRLKENFNINSKVFKDDNPNFILDYSKVLKNSGCFLTKLVPSIRILQTNYKENLVTKVYESDELITEKMSTLIYKLSREILAKMLNGIKLDKYFIEIDESMFQKGKLIILESIKNKILKEHLVLIITNNTYQQHKDYLRTLDYSFACNVDLTHIYNVIEKLNDLDQQMFFDYIIVDKYKEKDEEYLINFQCREGVEFFIIEGE